MPAAVELSLSSRRSEKSTSRPERVWKSQRRDEGVRTSIGSSNAAPVGICTASEFHCSGRCASSDVDAGTRAASSPPLCCGTTGGAAGLGPGAMRNVPAVLASFATRVRESRASSSDAPSVSMLPGREMTLWTRGAGVLPLVLPLRV